MSAPQTPGVPLHLADQALHRQLLAQAVNQAIGGKINVVVSLTLTASATTTSLIDPRLSGFSFVALMPLTAHAATALSAVYFTNQLKGSIVVNHASSANSDQSFAVLIIG